MVEFDELDDVFWRFVESEVECEEREEDELERDGMVRLLFLFTHAFSRASRRSLLKFNVELLDNIALAPCVVASNATMAPRLIHVTDAPPFTNRNSPVISISSILFLLKNKMKRKQTIVFPEKLDANTFHAFIIKKGDEWNRHKLFYPFITNEMVSFMTTNREACISTFGYPVTHGQFHAYITSFVTKKIDRASFLKNQQIDELTMRWLEDPPTLLLLMGHYGTEPPTKAPKKDLRDCGIYSNGYANTLEALNRKLEAKMKEIFGSDGIKLQHMIGLEPEDEKKFLEEAITTKDQLNEVIVEAREAYAGVVDSMKSYRDANRALVEAMGYKEYSEDEEEGEEFMDDDDEDEEDE